MKYRNNTLLLMLILLLLNGCSILPKTLNENNTIVVAHCIWIGKIGKKTVSQGAAKPILKNIETGKTYKPDYKKKTYTYFYKLTPGMYSVEEIVLESGQVRLHMKTADKTRVFEIDKEGVFFIGGLDITDYQSRFEYHVHEKIKSQQDVEIILDFLTSETSILPETDIIVIENVFIKDKWENMK